MENKGIISQVYLKEFFPRKNFLIRENVLDVLKSIIFLIEQQYPEYRVYTEETIFKNAFVINSIFIFKGDKPVGILKIDWDNSLYDDKFIEVNFSYAPTEDDRPVISRVCEILKAESLDKSHIYIRIDASWRRSINYYLEAEEFLNPLIRELFYGIDVEELANAFLRAPQGILILFGEPGTGKSKLIQYIIGRSQHILNKKVKILMLKGKNAFKSNADEVNTYIENDLVILDDFDFVSLTRRDETVSDIVSTILSVTDGFLPKKAKIIISTNKRLKEIDPALLRPSRLFDILELKPIPKEYFESLCKKYPELSPGLELFETVEELKVSEILDYIDRKRIIKKDYLIDKTISKRIKAYSKEIGF
ncbi:AAA family ATPase [Desulfurobacterium sp.]